MFGASFENIFFSNVDDEMIIYQAFFQVDVKSIYSNISVKMHEKKGLVF